MPVEHVIWDAAHKTWRSGVAANNKVSPPPPSDLKRAAACNLQYAGISPPHRTSNRAGPRPPTLNRTSSQIVFCTTLCQSSSLPLRKDCGLSIIPHCAVSSPFSSHFSLVVVAYCTDPAPRQRRRGGWQCAHYNHDTHPCIHRRSGRLPRLYVP